MFEFLYLRKNTGTTLVDTDEFPRHGTTSQVLAKLRPAFIKDGSGTVTAGNASGLNDGAAAVVLASGEVASKLGVAVMARVVSWAQAGIDPSIMGMGPVPAVQSAVSIYRYLKGECGKYVYNTYGVRYIII